MTLSTRYFHMLVLVITLLHTQEQLAHSIHQAKESGTYSGFRRVHETFKQAIHQNFPWEYDGDIAD